MKKTLALAAALSLAPALTLAAPQKNAIEVPSGLKDAVGPDGQEIGANTADQRKLAQAAQAQIMNTAHAEFNITDNVVEIVDRGPAEQGSMVVVVQNERDQKIAGGLLEAIIPELDRSVSEGHPRYVDVLTLDEYVAKQNGNAQLRAQAAALFAKGNFAVVHRHVRSGDGATQITLKPDLAVNQIP